MDSIYLDYNATTPLDKEVRDSINLAMTCFWGNPSSSHEIGRIAKEAVEESRCRISDMIGCSSDEIIFTSGGTETNNMVIHSAIAYFRKQMNALSGDKEFAYGNGNKKPHIITTNIEHDSISLPLKHLAEQEEIIVTFIPANKSTGQVDVSDIIDSIRLETVLITVIMANNETGIIQPIAELGAEIASCNATRLRSKKARPGVDLPILFHTDAAQAIGKMKVSVEELQVDFLTIVGHKFYGPRIGALFSKSKHIQTLSPMLIGGGQEGGIRPGTENTPMIVGLGKAAELVSHNLDTYTETMESMRNYLEQKLREEFGDQVIFNNIKGAVPRLPNTSSVAFNIDHVTGPRVLALTLHLCASTSAACHKSGEVSSVLISSGVTDILAKRTLRLSTGRETTIKDIDKAVFGIKMATHTLVNDSV